MTAAAHPRARCRVGIDVGGTFTDFVLTDTATGRLTYFKEPSVPKDPSLAVERGMLSLLDRAGLKPSDVELVVQLALGVGRVDGGQHPARRGHAPPIAAFFQHIQAVAIIHRADQAAQE